MKEKDIFYFGEKKGKVVLGKIDKDQCPGCGFRYGGIMRIHDNCPIVDKKVKEMLSNLK